METLPCWSISLDGLVWFLFYGPSTRFRSFRARSVNLATLSWASLLGSLPVLSAHSFAINWQLLFLNQRKRENGRRNVFMTKSPRKNVPDVGIELGAACMPSELASDRATAPTISLKVNGIGLLQNSFLAINSIEISIIQHRKRLVTKLLPLLFCKGWGNKTGL